MIGCEISGGLGNQFFRYAYSRKLQIDRRINGVEEQMIVNYKGVDSHGFSGSISDFKIVPHKKCKCRRVLIDYGYWWQKVVYAVVTRLWNNIRCLKRGRALLRFRQFILSKVGIILSDNPDAETICSISSKHDRVFPIGSFENYRYFDDIKDILCFEFTPIHDELISNKNLYKIIREQNSVCLAIRRGDFMREEFKKTFYVCDLTYFEKAIAYIQKHVSNPVFIVFSNDIEWVKDNLKIEGDVFYESGNDPVWETFRLMYSCKHFVISNSTLHWWAQYKASNPNKIVVVPDRWYNAPGWENHLFLDSFVRIPTGIENPYKVT